MNEKMGNNFGTGRELSARVLRDFFNCAAEFGREKRK